MGTITFLLVLSFLVFFHELGHFLAARYFGVKVETFSIGFGKQIYAKYWAGTTWQIALIPLGGYVKMKGQDDTKPISNEIGNDSYNTKKPWQRIIILFAGPFANFLLAFLLYLFMANLGATVFSAKVGNIQENSPAFHAGIKANDEIIRINDKSIESWDDIGKIITSTQGTLQFFIKRDNQIILKTIAPHISDSKNMFNEDIKKRMIGISPKGETKILQLSFFESISFAYEKTIFASTMIFQGVQKLIAGVIPSSEIGGVITIGKVISDASESSFIALLAITALISVNLGVLNLLPIPALDGGHIMFNLYEMITRRKPSDQVFIFLTIFGWVILGSLMILGIYNDINRIFINN
ncbi:Metalloprotease MmpA [Aliarcobacter thereius]|uniref:Zinc metalloprotease n=2 Tax=Aliarcobacter thereius TaxID=544718 RepID=A0A1C0B5D0_9BACT|nr:RIP metalloprotease RseP [Aliarcobacter thereius]OCL86065.1 Metalloprotease MmpA [Aliarcobacter thereius]OCL90545.1 Metalloprotease MmpA [Aliarcobacter thereius]OCL95648.1 Metalloprotease MmpA [Aliarcobacter thereius LMG 24486]OCL97930.1 Metalloprotease MmpA [Aliarcobacter thereius]QBF16365.1 RseP-like zinc metalloprotease, M50 family [Aliarcobacter thereius LMG 24486]